MTNAVTFLVDEQEQMLKVLIYGKVFGEGNMWDFNFRNDAQELLMALGIEVVEEEYDYEGEQ